MTASLARTTLALLLSLGALTPAHAAAQDPSPEAAYRQSLMQAFRIHSGGVRTALGAAAPRGHVEHHAIALDHMAQALANAFPEGSAGPGSRALPAIWQDRAAFMNQVTSIQSAAAQLRRVAQSGDAATIESALQSVQGTCRSCHQTFRSR